MELKATVKAMSKEEKDDFIYELREDTSNLEMEGGGRNKKDKNERCLAVISLSMIELN